MAITFFGVTSVPADNGTSAINPTPFSNPPIASMVVGDLVFVYAWCRTSSAVITVSDGGGQTWYSPSDNAVSSANTTLSARVFWCRYNGTWSAAPSFSFGATTNNSIVMLVFRPTNNGYTWGIDANTGVFEDRTAALSLTITGYPVTNDSSVSIDVWSTSDDNTWGTLTGAGWSKTGLSAQYRNIAGQDTSATFAYDIKTTSASTTDASQTQSTSDAGLTFSMSFYEIEPAPKTLNNYQFPKSVSAGIISITEKIK